MKSAQLSNFLSELAPGQIFMIYLYQKQGYWPTRVFQISKHDPKTKRPLKAKFQLFNAVTSSYRFTPRKIEIDLTKISSAQLIPFESVYNKKSHLQIAIESKNHYSQKESKQFEMVMRQATKAFEDQLKTPSMYQMLKKQAIKITQQSQNVKNQSPSPKFESVSNKVKHLLTKNVSNLVEPENITIKTEPKENSSGSNRNASKKSQTFKGIVNKTSSQIKESNESEKQSKRLSKRKKRPQPQSERMKNTDKKVIPEVPDGQNSSSVSKSRYKKKPIDNKRGHTQVLINNGSVNSLECPKKKRINSKKVITLANQYKELTSISSRTSNIWTSSSQIAPKSVKDISKKIEQKTQILKQEYVKLQNSDSNYASKMTESSKSNKDSGKSMKIETRSKQVSQNAKIQSLVSKKVVNKRTEVQRLQGAISRKSQAVWNRNQSRQNTIIQNSKKTKYQGGEIKIAPNSNVKVEFNMSSSEKSIVSNRTRSKISSNVSVKVQTTRNKKKSNRANLSKIQSSKQKRQIQKEKLKQIPLKNNKNNLVNKNNKNSKPISKFDPNKIFQKQKNVYFSSQGQQLGVQNLFFIFETLFDTQINQDDSVVGSRKGKKIPKTNLHKQSIDKPKLYTCIMSQEEALKLENEVKYKKNIQKQPHYHQPCQSNIEKELQQKEEQSEEQIFNTKCEQDADETLFPLNVKKQQKISKQELMNLNKIIEEKDESTAVIKNWQDGFKIETEVKNEEVSISFEDEMVAYSDTKIQEVSSKNEQLTKKLSMKYKMTLIQSFGDLISFIKDKLPQKCNLNQILHTADERQKIRQSNQMDLETNEIDSKLLPSKNYPLIIVFMVEKPRTSNVQSPEIHGQGIKQKNILINKKPKRKSTKKMSIIQTKTQNQYQKINKAQTSFVVQHVYTWSLQKVFLNALFTNLKNLNFSILLNPHFIIDLIQYRNSQEKFFHQIFPHIIKLNPQQQTQNSISSKVSSSVSNSLKSQTNSLKSQTNSQKSLKNNRKSKKKDSKNVKIEKTIVTQNPKPKHCGHSFCMKMAKSDELILQNLNSLFQIKTNFCEQDKVYRNYKSLIKKQAELMIEQFQINFRIKFNKTNGQYLDRNSFRHNYFKIVSSNLQQFGKQVFTSCFLTKILNLVGKVFNLISFQTQKITSSLKSGKIIEQSNSLGQKFAIDEKFNSASNLKDSNTQKTNDQIEKVQKIQFQKPVKHPDQKRYQQITSSPFDISMDDMDFQGDSQNSASQSINASGRTEFERTTNDFSSFLTNILPNVDIEKHKQNFKKIKKLLRSTHPFRRNHLEISSFRQYSEEKNQKPVNIYHKEIDQTNHFSYKSSVSAMVNNSEGSEREKNTKNASVHVFNLNRGHSNTTSVANSCKIEKSILNSQKVYQISSMNEPENMIQLKEEILSMFQRMENESQVESSVEDN